MKTDAHKSAVDYSRLISVDILRILAMLMVLVLHSGYLVINKNRTIKDNWQKTKKRILLPLAFFSVLNIIYAFSNFHYTGSNGIVFLQQQLVRVTNFPSSPLWFLVVLVFLYLLNPVWQVIFTDSKNRNIARYINFTAWIGFLFFYLYGGLIRNNWINISNNKINIGLVLFSFLAIVIGDYFTAYANVYHLNFIWNGYTFDYLSIPVILLSVGIFNIIIKENFDWVYEKNIGPKAVHALKWLAGLTFGIYLIHTYVVSIFTDKIGFSFDKLSINVYVYNILNYTLVLTISLIITYIIKKTPKLKMIIGE